LLVIDDLSTGRSANLPPDVDLVRHDLAEPGTEALVERFRPDVVVHAAAQVSVSRSTEDPATDARTNVLGTIRVLEGVRMAGTPTVVYVTTGGALYGEPRYLPCDEDHPIDPVSPYGLSKWVGERYLSLLASSARRMVLRLANVYGPRQNAEGEAGVVSIFATRMIAGRPVVVHGDGEQTRDFVYVEDVVAAVRSAVAAKADATVNIGSGVGTSVLALVAAMRAATGAAEAPTMGPPRAGDVRHSVLDVRRAATELGWQPTTSLADGLARTIAWYREDADRS
jgi:UDP-glucose 4-epimerase